MENRALHIYRRVKPRRRFLLITCLLAFCTVGTLKGASAALLSTSPPLRTIGEVINLKQSPATAGLPVRVTAEATYLDAEWGLLFVQDDSGAIFVTVGKEASSIIPGDVLDLRAVTAPGALGPILTSTHFAVLRHAKLPSPASMSLISLQAGADDSHLVLTEGVLHPGPESWNHTSLLLVDGQTQVPILIPRGVNLSIQRLVGAVVTVRGVNSANLDAANRRIGAQLLVNNVDEIQPKDQAWVSAMSLPLVPISAVQAPDLNQRFSPPVHLRVVDHSGGILIHSETPISADKQSVVDVTGFPRMQDGSLLLRDARFRQDNKAPANPSAPGPSRSPSWLFSSGRNGQSVTVQGKLVSQRQQQDEELLVLEEDGVQFLVRVAARESSDQIVTLSPNSLVQCEGVTRLVSAQAGHPASFEVLVDSPSHVIVHTRRALSIKLFTAIGVPSLIAGIILWIVQLNRAVRRSTIQIRQQLSELQAARDAAKFEAERDTLTGLPNRRLFFEILEQSTTAEPETDQSLALLYIDLDSFKMTNDTLGHCFGDMLLKQVAERFASCIRPIDTLCRIGGDEFAILMPCASFPDSAQQAADLLIQALQRPFYIDGQEVSIGASIGISSHPHPGTTASSLLIQSDAAMYAAKRSG